MWGCGIEARRQQGEMSPYWAVVVVVIVVVAVALVVEITGTNISWQAQPRVWIYKVKVNVFLKDQGFSRRKGAACSPYPLLTKIWQ